MRFTRGQRAAAVEFISRRPGPAGFGAGLRTYADLTTPGGAFRVSVLTSGQERAIQMLDTLGAVAIERADAAIRIEASAAAKRIAAKWPVDTGFSRSQWRAVQIAVGKWQIVNRANYTAFVHRRGETTPLVDTLIPAELATMSMRIQRRLRALIRQRSVLFRQRGVSLSL